jgi:diguanylate cyclase (GGDEF)-like protein
VSNDEPAPTTTRMAAYRALHAVTTRVHGSLDLGETLDAVARGVVEVTGFAVAAINLRLPTGDFQVVSVVGDDLAREALLGTIASEQAWRAMLADGVRWDDLLFLPHRDGPDERYDVQSYTPDREPSGDEQSWHPADALLAPLTAPSGELVGVLSVDVPLDGRLPDREQCEMLSLFADHAAIAIEHARVHAMMRQSREALRYSATHDPLTGLANRALLMDRAGALAAVPGSRLAVVMLDLDRFKMVNDTFGHPAGDEILQEMSARMRSSVGEDVVVARMGGDEFAIALGGQDAHEAVRVLVARLRVALTEPVHGVFGTHQVGVSIGVAVAQTPTQLAPLLASADAEMYRWKQHRALDLPDRRRASGLG